MTPEKAKLMRESYPRAFSPWTQQDDEKLAELMARGTAMLMICKELQRQPTAIKRRMELLGMKQAQEKVTEKNYVTGEGISPAPEQVSPGVPADER
jgi:hypothetical protein